MNKIVTICLSLIFLNSYHETAFCNADSQNEQLGFLFQSGTNGYNTFRIPAIITTVKGTLLAFAEGRKKGSSDTGDIDLVMKRSEDNGKTWNLGGTTPQDQVNECTVAELSDGKLMLNMRNYDRTQKTRKVTISNDGGLTWTNIRPDPALIEPICQGSLINYPKKRILFFSNPANENSRENLTLRMSYDEGKTWPVSKVLHNGPAAYSDLTILSSDEIGCFYEAGNTSPYEGIVFKKISIKELGK